jgi:hypothetical protein
MAALFRNLTVLNDIHFHYFGALQYYSGLTAECVTEHCGWWDGTLALYAGGPGFKSQHGDHYPD